MKKTIHLHDFRDEFNAIRPNNFSYEGLEILFNYLEEIDEDLELDVIGICCDFSEGGFLEVANELDEDEDELTEECYGLDEDETAQVIVDKLSNKTTVLGITSDNCIVYANF